MLKGSILIINYAKKMEGTAIATRMYYETLRKSGKVVEWHQLVDRFETDSYMSYPKTWVGSHVPFRTIRTGYDRLVYFPLNIKKITGGGVFIADPTLMRIGLKSGNFMVKVHDLIPISKYSESASYRMIFRYTLPKLEKASTVIVTTDHMKEKILPFVKDESKIMKVTEPVNVSNGKSEQTGSRSSKNRDFVNVAYVAADRPYKNIRFYADIASLFQKLSLKRYRFVLVSKLKGETRDYIDSLHLRNFSILTSINDISEVYNKTDILVNTSLQEGFGRPIVEAMSHGVPSIAGDIEPFREIIGNSGLLISHNQPDDWVEAILSLSEPNNLQRFSSLCRKRFEDSFSHKIFSMQLNQAFDTFLQNIGV